ncbi:MAG: sugar phosphate isomerase/epimerase [Gemmatimonadota bacterium]|nr:sugar phosphate isomerase/epimerase [Gemmatimonadota bacterium]
MIDRRTFVKALGASTAGMAIGCSTPNVNGGKKSRTLDRIGIQLYTLRQDMERDFDGTLASVAAIGYKEVETAGYFGRSPANVRATLDRLGLSAPAAHIGNPSVLKTNWEKTIENSRIIGHQYLIVPFIPEEERRTLDDYRRLADLFNAAGETARNAGVRLGYHNHDFEFVPLEGKLPYDVLLERTQPALVAMELDLFWITKGGQDPLAYFDRHRGRFEAVHVKDMETPPTGKMVAVGHGKIDFSRIFAQREKAGIRHFFVEHDNPEPPALGSAKTSYDYLRQLKF